TEAGLVVVDATLSPVQQRNLERRWKTKVIDRTGLILEIFGERARTREGQLQVELAHLSYQRSRLVRSWTHLERQRGGAGFLGGPGETQIELDRRQIDDRIIQIKRQLDDVRRTRSLHRDARARVPYPVVALVGYTNAGKSTLFNRLTRATVLAKDMLFATLDPTMRAIEAGQGRRIILSDTVGFISDLPTHLVAAFRATLEEVQAADLILHVRDIAHPDTEAQREDVEAVLRDLDIDIDSDGRVIEVLNKADLLPEAERETLSTAVRRRGHDAAVISALTGEGCDGLMELIARRINADRETMTVKLDIADGRTLAWLHEHGEVLEARDDGAHLFVRVRLHPNDAARLHRQLGIATRH
ncbi:GTPase HflX, partial [Inquilinus sp.]